MKDKPKDFLANEHESQVGKIDYGCEVYGGPPQPTAKFTATELSAMGYRGVYRLDKENGAAEDETCACGFGFRCNRGVAVGSPDR